MKDKENQDQKVNQTDEPVDLMLAREIRNLDREMQPTRDLWSGIERNIIEHPQRKKSEWSGNWMPYGVAASLVIALGSLLINLMGNNQSPYSLAPSEAALTNIQSEYVKVRNPLVDQFTENNKQLAPETLNDLYLNIEIMEKARRDIEAQIRQNPDDHRLVEMLMRVHAQEIELLKQDYSKPSRSM